MTLVDARPGEGSHSTLGCQQGEGAETTGSRDGSAVKNSVYSSRGPRVQLPAPTIQLTTVCNSHRHTCKHQCTQKIKIKREMLESTHISFLKFLEMIKTAKGLNQQPDPS